MRNIAARSLARSRQSGSIVVSGGERVVGLPALLRAAVAELGGQAKAGQERVAARRLLREGRKDFLQIFLLAFGRQLHRVLILGRRRLGGLVLPVLVEAPAADRGDDKDRAPDDEPAIGLPDLGDPVAAILLVDLAEKLFVLGHRSCGSGRLQREGGRLAQGGGQGERRAAAEAQARGGRTGTPIRA